MRSPFPREEAQLNPKTACHAPAAVQEIAPSPAVGILDLADEEWNEDDFYLDLGVGD